MAPQDVPVDDAAGERYSTSPVPVEAVTYYDQKNVVEIYYKGLTNVSDADFAAANFKDLCPSGNCIHDCSDLERLFSSVPEDISDGDDYKEWEVTFFTVCSNLAYVSAMTLGGGKGSDGDGYAGYFAPLNDEDVSANISMITSNIGSCFSSTCGKTREPAKCEEHCALDNFLGDPEHLLFSFESDKGGVMSCVKRLCDNTCGLPYAEQDVMGIGVLVSYYIQSVVLLLAAAKFIASAIFQLVRRKRVAPKVYDILRSPLSTWLKVQCYFGITAAVASLFMDPWTVDPLNGYALLAVAVMGFVPPVFTLVLLHSHRVESWFATALVLASYIFNTITFFMLHKTLSAWKPDTDAMTESLTELLGSGACGGNSAVHLCRQFGGLEPLTYLNGFFNRGSIPNIKTIPVLWGWTTLALIVALVAQLYRSRAAMLSQKTIQSEHGKEKLLVPGGGQPQKQQQWRQHRLAKGGLLESRLAPTTAQPIRVASLVFTSILFSLALAYNFRVVRQYQMMDVIDENDWSFGQVVGVLFWAPPLLDAAHSVLKKLRRGDVVSGAAARLQTHYKPVEERPAAVDDALFSLHDAPTRRHTVMTPEDGRISPDSRTSLNRGVGVPSDYWRDSR